MKKAKELVLWTAIVLLPGLLSGCGTYRHQGGIWSQVRAGSFAEPGETVRLFHGMSGEGFRRDAVVSVYRADKGTSPREVGKVKVIKDLGDHYLEAVVAEGEVRPGDVARLAESACLVAPSERTSPTLFGL